MENKDEILEIDQQWQTYHEKLLERCFWGTDNYEWSRLSKLPLKVINILQPMTWRMRELMNKLLQMVYLCVHDCKPLA